MNTLETEGQMLQRVMPDLMGMKNPMVMNDEGHHCYREKPGEDDVDEIERFRREIIEPIGCSRRTAARDLDDLLRKGLIQRLGAGRSAYYVLVRNRAINLPIVPSSALQISSDSDAGNRDINVPNVPSPETLGSKPPKAKSKKDHKSATKVQSGNNSDD